MKVVASRSEAPQDADADAGRPVKAAPKTGEPDKLSAGLNGVSQSLLERVSSLVVKVMGLTSLARLVRYTSNQHVHRKGIERGGSWYTLQM